MIDPIDAALLERLTAFRRDLHRHPELSWEETRTADQVCHFLDELGIAYRRDCAKTGVIAEIPGATGDEAFVAIRADLDALPIHEETGLPFASERDGVMHACGHDGHTSIALGAGQLLAASGELPASVRLIFQPAEEVGEGALAMIEAGALDRVRYIFGGHVDRHYQLGEIIVTDGAVNASSDEFHISIGGQGGHAARPHETVDAVVVGSLLVMAIQTIVSREVNPAHPSVVTVGRFDAGTAPNVIAGHAALAGSIRAQDPEVREFLINSIRRIAKSVGELHGAKVEVEIRAGTPPVINPPGPTALAREAALRVVGADKTRPLEVANMGAEDFAFYLDEIPGCYVRFGVTTPDREAHPAHSSRFDFDERVIGVGAAYFAEVAKLAGEKIRAELG